jgi:hypothetical protein
MKMHAFPKWILLGLLIGGTSACGSKEQATGAIAASQDSVGTLEINLEETAYEEPPRPDPKSDAELAALKTAWEAAVVAEKKFLDNPQLEQWIAGLKTTEDEDGMPVYGKLDAAKFDALTPKEILHYTTFHPESWDQICAEFMFDAGTVKAISPNLPMSGDYASERQAAAMKAHQEAIAGIVVACLNATQTVSEQMLHTIVEQDMRVAIGPLVEIYRTQKVKDDLILSALIELMEQAEYAAWVSSEPRKHVHDVWTEWMPLTAENADQIIYYAQKFATT